MRNTIRVAVGTVGWILAATCMSPRVEVPFDPVHNAEAEWHAHGGSSGIAQVRFVNGIPGSDQLDVIANEHLAFVNVGHDGVTDYAEVGVREAMFTLRAPDGSVVARLREELDANGVYTLIAAHDEKGAPLLVAHREDGAGVVREDTPFLQASAGHERPLFMPASN